MSARVTVAGLVHRYGDLGVLGGLDLTIEDGGLTALIGPTGCGKSTVLRILAGLVTPTSGTVTIDGASTVARPVRAGYMPQGDTLLPWRTALSNATLAARIGSGSPSSGARAPDLFRRFGLAGFEDAWPSELSGGMRQRVALLRTVLAERPVLLLDEPFGALDAITRMDLQGWLGDLLRHERRTTLLVTHDVDEALRLADEVIVLSPRPARVVERVGLADPRPRHPDRLTDPDLVVAKRRVLDALRSA